MQKSLSRLSTCVVVVFVFCLAFSYFGLYAADENQDAEQDCNDLVAELKQAIIECSDMNSNWSCYANYAADVVPVEHRFHSVRDRRPLSVLESIDTKKSLTATSEYGVDYGVVFMNLDIKGQTDPMTAMLFGDSSLKANDPGQHDFLFAIENTTNLCTATPPGMILRTKEGKRGRVKINRVTIRLGSTAFITMDDDQIMTVVNLEGSVAVSIDGIIFISIPLNGQLWIDLKSDPPTLLSPDRALSAGRSPWADSVVFRALISDQENGLERITNSNEDEKSEKACIGNIEFNQSVPEVITNPGQECLFELCLEAPVAITVWMTAINPDELNPWLDIRDATGKLIAVNNDIDRRNRDSLLCNVTLPVTQIGRSCYNIVARSYRNLTSGAFDLLVAPGGVCTDPQPRCEVLNYPGLYLRTGPGVDYQVKAVLSQHTQLLQWAPDNGSGWTGVTVLDAGGTETNQWGYVSTNPRYLLCEFGSDSPVASTPVTPPGGFTPITSTPATSTPGTPFTVTPTPTNPQETETPPIATPPSPTDTDTPKPPTNTPEPPTKSAPYPGP
jgi:hypothetical protein